MDREIPKEVRQKERNKKIIRYSAIGGRSYCCQCTHLFDESGSRRKRSCFLYSRQRGD